MTVGRLTKREAVIRLRHCLETGWIDFRPHFFVALADEGLTYEDVRPVLMTGRVLRAPEWREGEWRYRIEGAVARGDEVAVVFSFDEDMGIVITTFVL